MNRFKRWGRTHFLCIGVIAVIASLFIMLGLQYRSLAALERTTAVEHRVMLMNYLTAVTAEVIILFITDSVDSLSWG